MDELEQLNDATLLARYAQSGDRDALGVLFRRYVDAAYATAMRVCRNSADAEDAVQTAFMQVLQRADSFRGQSEYSVRAWLMAIVANACKQTIRSEVHRRQRQEEVGMEQDDVYVGEDPAGPESDLDARSSEVLEELDQLPAPYRAAIWLHHYDGLSQHDAAEALGMSEKSLNNRVFRGMSQLRHRLAARGLTVTMAGLTAAIPMLRIGPAPGALVEKMADIAADSVGMAVSETETASGLGQFKSWLILAVAMTAAVGTGVVLWQRTAKESPVGATPPASVPQEFHYRWDFNEPGIPPEFKILMGSLKHMPGCGQDGSGCIESSAGENRIRIDIPLSGYPFVVKWQVSALVPKSCWSKVYMLPASNVVLFANVITNKLLDFRKNMWQSHADYVASDRVVRFKGDVLQDAVFGLGEKDAKVVLLFEPEQRIDNIEIHSIRPDQMPDSSQFSKVIEAIPRERRVGQLGVGRFGDSDIVTNLAVRFIPRVNAEGKFESAK